MAGTGEIISETPQWLCDIIAKLHAKNPDDRFQSAREVADVLADCEAQLKVNSKLKGFSRIPRGKPTPRRIVGVVADVGHRMWSARAGFAVQKFPAEEAVVHRQRFENPM